MSDENEGGTSTKVDVDVTNPVSAPPAERPEVPADPAPDAGNAAPEHGDVAAGHPSEGGNEGTAG